MSITGIGKCMVRIYVPCKIDGLKFDISVEI